MIKGGYAYILANNRPTLYVGVTANLEKRIWEHKNNLGSKFTIKYQIKKLIFFEYFDFIETAIIREKQLKNLSRQEKLDLIGRKNPHFLDLSNTLKVR